jgi:hypothetical protein
MSVANTLIKGVPTAPSITSQYAGGGSGGAGVSSLNGLTGGLNIAGAGGISVAAAGSTITITGGGGPPGLYLPLAGGNMDASPAGVIGAHTITGLTTLEGDAAGNDLSILTQAGGADIAIDATASGGSLFVDAYSTQITTGTGAGAKVEINGKVVVQPPAGYTYPDNPEYAVDIKNWTNPTANLQAAIGISTISSTADANGVFGGSITSTGGSAVGVNFSSLQGQSSATGILLNTMSSPTHSLGIDIQNVVSDNQVDGISATNMTSGNICAGMRLTNMVGPGGSYGAVINGVDAASNPGSGANAKGMEVAGVNADGETSGIDVFKIIGNNTAPVYGIRVSDIRGDDSVGAVGGNDVYGMQIIDVRDNVGSGNSTGLFIGKIYNNTNTSISYGLRVSDINNDDAEGVAIQSINGGNIGRGVNMNSITAKAEAVAYFVDTTFANTDNACAFRAVNTTCSDSVAFGLDLQKVSAPNSEAYGIRVSDVIGNQKTFGTYLTNITSQNATAYGNIIGGVNAPTGEAYGYYITSVNGDAKTFGSYVASVNSTSADAFGHLITGIVANNAASHGIYLTSVVSDNNDAEGILISGISAATNAYGINIDNLKSTTSAFGVRIGPGFSSPDNNGFVQEGTIGLKVRNKLDNELQVGIYEDATTGLSLKVNGNAFYSAQLINNPGAQIIPNKGNLIVVQNIGAPYSVVLPSGLAQEGHQFTICMRSTTAVSFNAGGGILVNGGTSWTCPGIVNPNYRMLQAFYTSVAGVGEWLIG